MGKAVRFGRYLLERRLAMGGMAEVLLAHLEGAEGFRKKVVVKRILPHLLEDDNHVSMFLDEARLAARFDHPNLIQVYGLEKIEEQYCLAMEYIEGKDVASILDTSLRLSRQLPIDIAAYIVARAAEGLHYAHELTTDSGEPLHVVHRDVSPANIIVTWHGGVKIVDFGIAKHKISTAQTVAGTIKGKFSYMSPEQARSEAVDRRSDIFSLGTILYELLTVSPCFPGSNQIEILENVSHARYRPPQQLRPEVPARLERLLARMLAADRDDRFSTADEVRVELKRFLADTNDPAPNDVGSFLSDLFGRSKESSAGRVATAIHDFDEVLVTEEFSSPDMVADAELHRRMVESQVQQLADLETDGGSKIAPRDFEVSEKLEPFEIPSTEPIFSRSSTHSKMAHRPREPRLWPGLLIIGSIMAIGAMGLVMMYRAALDLPWRPTEILSEVAGRTLAMPLPARRLGQAALRVVTAPPGAVVTVDGDPQRERTPLTVNDLSVQKPHWVVVELPGYARESKKISIRAVGLQTLTLTLRPLAEQPEQSSPP